MLDLLLIWAGIYVAQVVVLYLLGAKDVDTEHN
jgi:hypothetical protein